MASRACPASPSPLAVSIEFNVDLMFPQNWPDTPITPGRRWLRGDQIASKAFTSCHPRAEPVFAVSARPFHNIFSGWCELMESTLSSA